MHESATKVGAPTRQAFRRFYSQHGEDAILSAVFDYRCSGFFVEVGCIDGRRFSNTLAFEKAGWRGLCVEAHAGYVQALKQNRPNALVCHCAAGSEDRDSVPFFANSRGSLSTLDPSREAYYRARFAPYFTGFERQNVPMKRLDTLFKDQGITAIDIVSIDVEGAEVEALRGIDLTVYRPSIFVINSETNADESALDQVLLARAFRKFFRLAGNVFYSAHEFKFPHSLLSQRSIAAEITHTRHPLDTGSDQTLEIQFDVTSIRRLIQRIPAEPNVTAPTVLKETNPPADRFRFCEEGFHGDKHLLEIVDFLVRDRNYLVETGANVGSTLAYVARKYPHLLCWSCEPDAEAYSHAVRNAARTNVTLFNETSQNFLVRLSKTPSLFGERALFWLDAHGYGFQWPLRDEIAFITSHFASGFVLIDDFKVPDADVFGFDRYADQECSFEYIQNSIDCSVEYTLYYPNYRDKTSTFHPLRGWGLIVFGNPSTLEFPSSLRHFVRPAAPNTYRNMQKKPDTDNSWLIQSALAELTEEVAGSVGITDRQAIDRFVANPDNPFLVSFPRTGSHWLRMIMELYFERPSLVRAFYFPSRTDYLTLHTHDIDLNVQRKNVIYLYRDPVDTVYSQLGYYRQSPDDIAQIRHWGELYGRHLDKWLHQERFTIRKTALTFEGLHKDVTAAFQKLCDHFGETLDTPRLLSAYQRTSKSEVKRKTGHDRQVINVSNEYSDRRSEFRTRHATLVWDTVLSGRPHLKNYFGLA